jgi:hypothetical protein
MFRSQVEEHVGRHITCHLPLPVCSLSAGPHPPAQSRVCALASSTASPWRGDASARRRA